MKPKTWYSVTKTTSIRINKQGITSTFTRTPVIHNG